MGVSRSLSSHEEADQETEGSQGTQEPHTDEEEDVPTNADTPSVSGAFGVFKTARKALKLQDVSDTDDQDEDADTCTMCQKAYPPSGKSKNITWIECSQCHHWYHLQCAGLNKAPQKKKKWFCASCRKNQKE